MYSVSPEHLWGLIAGLAALPLALWLLPRQRRWAAATGTAQAAAVLMVVTGAVHIGLLGHHLESDPLTSVLFAINGALFFWLAFHVRRTHWSLFSSLLLVATITGYAIYIAAGREGPDQVGIATKLVELTALGLVLVPVAGERRRTHRSWRWATVGAALPVLTLITVATVWIDDLARPDAQHVHAGAVLQATNRLPTQQQSDAAANLYRETAAAIVAYQDWHQAWAAGFRPGGPSNLPSTHWMNQRNVDVGYVMDPKHPQGLVYANSKHGPVLLGAMFQMKGIGQFGPDPGGPITAWHEHENICFSPFGSAISFMSPTGTCPLGAIDFTAPPMLHVWIVDNPQGPFAVDVDSNLVKAIDNT